MFIRPNEVVRLFVFRLAVLGLVAQWLYVNPE